MLLKQKQFQRRDLGELFSVSSSGLSLPCVIGKGILFLSATQLFNKETVQRSPWAAEANNCEV